jgi:hypothetical protein
MKQKAPAPFKIGDKVKLDRRGEEKIIRTVIGVKDAPYPESGSGYLVQADGGEICKSCGRLSTETCWMDSTWFKKVKQ